jgi:hypothetical protein
MAIQITVHIEGKVQWGCFRAKGGSWIGVCDPLKLTVQADTWAELMEDIGHTLDAMLSDLLKTNELDKFLQVQGWQATGPIPRKNVRFDVPFIPAIMAAHGQQASVHQ